MTKKNASKDDVEDGDPTMSAAGPQVWDKGISMNTEGWDMFMTVSRDSGIVAAQCFEGPVRIVKCVVYLLFFLIILICTFASKVSLLALTTGAGDQNKSKYERDLILVMICLAICVPNVLTFLESLLKSVFSNKAWPTFSTIFVVLIIEAAHTFGLCILAYKILPQFDVVRAILLLCCCNMVPGLFKLLLTRGGRGPVAIIMDILAMLMQFSACFMLTRLFTRDKTPIEDFTTMVEAISAMVLISFRYWENFIDCDIGMIRIQNFKQTLRIGRCKTYIFASLWKIGLSLAFIYILIPNMTPMAELFSNIQNETLFSVNNETSSFDLYDDGGNFSGIPDFSDYSFPGEEDDADLSLRLRRQAGPRLFDYDFTTEAQENDRSFGRNTREPIFDDEIDREKYDEFDNYDEENENRNGNINRNGQTNRNGNGNRNGNDPRNNGNNRNIGNNNRNGNNGRNGNGNGNGNENGNGNGNGGRNQNNRANNNNRNNNNNNNNINNNNRIRARVTPERARTRKTTTPRPVTTTPTPQQEPEVDEEFYDYDDYEQEAQSAKPVNRLLYRFLPLIIQALSGAVCYYFARVACKLCMQEFSFSLPLTIITPATAGAFVYLCYLEKWTRIVLPNLDIGFWKCPESFLTFTFQWQIGACVGLWWLSQIWINNHVWFPKTERLAKVERLFILPQYCSVLLEQSLMLNRRRNDVDDIPVPKRVKSDLNLDDSVSVISEGEKARISEGVNTRICVCSTMWHETANEMVQVLKSIMRMDVDQAARANAQEYFGVKDPDFYEFEAHIFIDDGMEYNKNQERICNRFVKQLVDVIELAATSIHETQLVLLPPVKTPTPYGGRLTWTLPGGNFLYVHLKDNSKIRHKKRWSQVMYMYYLLGYRLLGNYDDSMYSNQSEVGNNKTNNAHITQRSRIFRSMNHIQRAQAENTYLLTLDGDIDFKAECVTLLVDRMKKNKKVGAACGRIHPIGTGPMVWYQKFEYAIGHWLQKAAEHMLGCVLCSPGCFSLFRGSAIMDDNVMRTYATKSTEARHYVQYDQGEDRWLCTLLLQQGYKVEYCAAADASTYAPETFKEFYNQRRRWIPSTLANMMDLLSDYHRTVLVNDNISYLYMMYQAVVMGASLLAPATVILMVSGAIHVVVGGNLYWLWLAASVSAAIFYMLVCFKTKPQTQITIAGYMSTFYAILMLAVTVGIVVQTSQDSWTSPNALFIMVIAAIFMLAGILHPEEFLCVIPGALYFLCIPSGFLLMFIYSMINMNVVSWGTREIIKKENIDDVRKREKKAKRRAALKGIRKFFLMICCCIKDKCVTAIESRSQPQPKKDQIVREIMAELERIETGKNTTQCSTSGYASTGDLERQPSYDRQSSYDSSRGSGRGTKAPLGNSLLEARQRSIVRQLDSIHSDINRYDGASNGATSVPKPNGSAADKYTDSESLVYSQTNKDNDPYYSIIQNQPKIQRDDLVNPYWITEKEFKRGPVRYLDNQETVFWQKLMEKYLYPLNHDKEHEAKITQDLKALRNNSAFLFFMLNFLWLFIIFLLQVVQDQLKDTLYITIPKQDSSEEKHFEPLSVAFLVFFATIMMIQFISMLFHRYGTFMHILASTSLRCCSKKYKGVEVEDVVKVVRDMQRIKGFADDSEPDPDYMDSDDLDEQNPDVISCGAESQRKRKPQHYSNKTLRGAFVKRYNALSKRSQRNKPKHERPGIGQVFDNVAFQDQM